MIEFFGTGVMIFAVIISVLQILSVVFSLLFMHYSAKYRNQELSVGWYICGVLFGLWTIIVFLIKRKDFPGSETKKCYQCKGVYPAEFEGCPNCNVYLPQIDSVEKQKQKKLSRGFGIAIAVIYSLSAIAGIIYGVMIVKSVISGFENFDTGYRISVDGVFYDKLGNSYEDEDSVVLYDAQGYTYVYTVEEVAYEEDELFSYEEEYYVRQDGKKYSLYDCYVTADGWFYCDKASELMLYELDTSTMSEDELDAYYDELMEQEEKEYKYYDYPYADAAGNLYYAAYEASWNEKGELITAENDISIEK